jgi:hypothetical protein
MYSHGSRQGFEDFRRVVRALNGRFGDATQWMKLSEMGRYAAARELTRVAGGGAQSISLQAPFACSEFTMGLQRSEPVTTVHWSSGSQQRSMLRRVKVPSALVAGTWWHGKLPSRFGERQSPQTVICFDLPRGDCQLEWN